LRDGCPVDSSRKTDICTKVLPYNRDTADLWVIGVQNGVKGLKISSEIHLKTYQIPMHHTTVTI